MAEPREAAPPPAATIRTPQPLSRVIDRIGALYAPLTAITRLPFSMMVIGVLTLAVAARGSVQLGGLTSAMVGLGIACCGPLLGGMADRFGQRPLLLVVGALNSAALAALAWVAYSPLPDWALLVSAAIVGATAPQTSPMSRTRLVTAIDIALPPEQRPRAVTAALAFETATDEVVFVFGPVIVGALATAFGGAAPIIGAAVLTLVCVTLFALHRTSAPAKSRAERAAALGPVWDLLRPALLIVVFGALAVGMFFGSMLTALTAFLDDRGLAEQAGLLYGAMGVGSAFLAIGIAWLSPRFTLPLRWVVFAALLVVGAVLLQNVADVSAMLWTLALVGLGVGPLLVTLFGFAAARTPEGRSATVMTMVGAAIMVGQALSAAVTGAMAESFGSASALMLPLTAAVLGLLGGIVNLPISRRMRIVDVQRG